MVIIKNNKIHLILQTDPKLEIKHFIRRKLDLNIVVRELIEHETDI